MTGLHPYGACEAPGCGKALPIPQKFSSWKIVRKYCDTACASRAWKARRPSRKKPSREAACAVCGDTFTPRSTLSRYCGKTCLKTAKRQQGHDGQRPGDKAVRAAATQEALRRARVEKCPRCKSRLGADETLLYCAKRCGFFELLTAKERDPRADTDTPDTDQETEEMSLEEDHDTEEEIAASGRPAPTYATPRGEATRAKIRELLLAFGPSSTPDLAAHLGLDRSGVLRHLRAMPELKSTGKGKGTLWQLVDEARPVEAKAPKAKPAPAPERKPAGLVELRRQIAELSAADLDALLVDLAALTQAHAALCAAREALRG